MSGENICEGKTQVATYRAALEEIARASGAGHPAFNIAVRALADAQLYPESAESPLPPPAPGPKDDQDGRPKTLTWGLTPFHYMARAELLEQAQRLYAAGTSMRSVLKIHEAADPHAPYWTQGTGGKALERGAQALTLAEQGYSSRDVYDAFYAYANDLLFSDNPAKPDMEMRREWHICPKCGLIVGSVVGPSPNGKTHSEYMQWGPCDGIMRPFTWDDLKPLKSATSKE